MIRQSLRALTPAAWAIVALCLLLALVVARCAWDAGVTDERAAATVSAVTRDSAAKETAADQRLNDAAANAALKEDLSHAVDALPDTRPSDRRRALACARLRDQGTDTAALPACDGPQGRAQAPA